MCTVYNFPKQFKMPKEMEERLQGMAKDYVDLLNESMEYFMYEEITDEEYEKITGLILGTFLEGIGKAIEQLD